MHRKRTFKGLDSEVMLFFQQQEDLEEIAGPQQLAVATVFGAQHAAAVGCVGAQHAAPEAA